MQEDSAPVVDETAEGVAGSLDLLDEEVQPSVGPLDAPVAWWLRISFRQRGEGPSERLDLRDPVSAAPLDHLVEQQLRVRGVVGELDVVHGLLRAPSACDISVGITEASLE